MNLIEEMIDEQVLSNNPIYALKTFIEEQNKLELSRELNLWKFVGYVLELGYDSAKIITSDRYRKAVGGIPRGSYLIMIPEREKEDRTPYHFSLLRVKDVSDTPLSNNVQQTHFELHKKSMPELDVWTESELQWGALECDVLGMFYPDPKIVDKIHFSGDVNNIVSAHKYRVFSPNEELLDLIVNGLIKKEYITDIGKLRTTECLLMNDKKNRDIDIKISIRDFLGCRTAMFGKTRLGKSNVVKLIAQGVLDSTDTVGQVIFDLNGEYANDNEQDGGKCLRSINEDRCDVYALTPRAATKSKPLRLNFYEIPNESKQIISELLDNDNKKSDYITAFSSVELMNIEDIKRLTDYSKKVHEARKIQIYWAILYMAGFEVNEKILNTTNFEHKYTKGINPGFKNAYREAIYGKGKVPTSIDNFTQLIKELKLMYEYSKNDKDEEIFDSDEIAMLGILFPKNSSYSGTTILSQYRRYHHKDAGNFKLEILNALEQGKTIILDLGNATDEIRKYFSNIISTSIFNHQEKKFVNNQLDKDSYIQLYFEEAHNLFPPDSKDLTGVYARFAKEGAKFHIGMVYSTQSPSTINKELLVQTENFFIGHISSQEEVKALSRLQNAFNGIEQDILKSRTPGYMRMLTLSHRFVIPVQAKLFKEIVESR